MPGCGIMVLVTCTNQSKIWHYGLKTIKFCIWTILLPHRVIEATPKGNISEIVWFIDICPHATMTFTVWRLSVCLSHTSGLSREQRGIWCTGNQSTSNYMQKHGQRHLPVSFQHPLAAKLFSEFEKVSLECKNCMDHLCQHAKLDGDSMLACHC